LTKKTDLEAKASSAGLISQAATSFSVLKMRVGGKDPRA